MASRVCSRITDSVKLDAFREGRTFDIATIVAASPDAEWAPALSDQVVA
jgi:hypothetical protein